MRIQRQNLHVFKSYPTRFPYSIVGYDCYNSHIIGDNQLKGSATKINQYLNTNVVVSSFIKPGANIKQIVHYQEGEFKCLGKKDIIVVNGETNDLENNTEKKKSVLVHMLQFAQKYTNTNIMMVNIPLRHDLAMNSCINLEIQDFNNKLSKRAQLFSHVDLVEMNFNRKYFTKHGLHLNNVGKEGLAKVIAFQINTIIKCSSNDKPVIPLLWEISLLIRALLSIPLTCIIKKLLWATPQN